MRRSAFALLALATAVFAQAQVPVNVQAAIQKADAQSKFGTD